MSLGSAGLGIKRVDVTRGTPQPDKNDRLRFCVVCGRELARGVPRQCERGTTGHSEKTAARSRLTRSCPKTTDFQHRQITLYETDHNPHSNRVGSGWVHSPPHRTALTTWSRLHTVPIWDKRSNPWSAVPCSLKCDPGRLNSASLPDEPRPVRNSYHDVQRWCTAIWIGDNRRARAAAVGTIRHAQQRFTGSQVRGTRPPLSRTLPTGPRSYSTQLSLPTSEWEDAGLHWRDG